MICHSASTISWYCEGSLSRISAFSFSLLSSSSTFSIKIFGFSKRFGCCSNPAYEKVFLKATPSTRKDSRRVPPTTFLTPIILRLRVSWSSVDTASTTMRAKKSFSPAMSFEFREVIAHLWRTSSFSVEPISSMVVLMSRMVSVAMRHALRKAVTTLCGWTPSSMKGFASLRSSPARTTTVVVPSPTSESWEREMSTSSLAAGCTMSRSFIRVAPSLEIVVFPRSSWMSLSMPRGPRVVRTASTTAMQALMLLTSWGMP
mmetsp:Transcript_5567/g.14422  ORF Transcript_5567/g.14422 Transcript_5567/m.14422 type:complete len:259 (+) Transcript_5567:1000-1776(+)